MTIIVRWFSLVALTLSLLMSPASANDIYLNGSVVGDKWIWSNGGGNPATKTVPEIALAEFVKRGMPQAAADGLIAAMKKAGRRVTLPTTGRVADAMLSGPPDKMVVVTNVHIDVSKWLPERRSKIGATEWTFLDKDGVRWYLTKPDICDNYLLLREGKPFQCQCLESDGAGCKH